ncbi:MAG: hypothetical protein Q4C47_08225, partial [Planctomycetia bacterium]|nr:hypothetical protein [Planctomycetia bacterium]
MRGLTLVLLILLCTGGISDGASGVFFATYFRSGNAIAQESGTTVSAASVRRAIQGGVRFLRSQQREDGTWGDYVQYRGGLTSLAMHALLTSGESPDDPAIAEGLTAVRQIPLEYTYVVSLQLMVLSRVGDPADQARITECVRWLEQAQGNSGGWSYQEQPGEAFDLSNTQFAILGLYEAERCGIAVSPRTWQRVFTLLQSFQNQDGSWGYSSGSRHATGSMTCAGIGGVMMALDSAAIPNARVRGENIECCLDNPLGDETLAKGLRWIGRNFSASRNPGSGDTNRLYYLYGIERIGRLTGNRFFVREIPAAGGNEGDNGNVAATKYDWYREGCHAILTWKGDTSDHWNHLGGNGENHPVIATSYALLFL